VHFQKSVYGAMLGMKGIYSNTISRRARWKRLADFSAIVRMKKLQSLVSSDQGTR